VPGYNPAQTTTGRRFMDTSQRSFARPQAVGMHIKQFTAAKFLVIVSLGMLLYFAHVAFIPIALALLFALILSGPVEALHKFRVPRSVSATLILVIVLGIIAGTVDFMWAPAQQWFASAPQTMKSIQRKLTPATRFVDHVEQIRTSAGKIGTSQQPGAAPGMAAPAAEANDKAPRSLVDALRGVVISTVTFIIVTLFLLAGGPPMLARMTAAFVDDLNAAHVLNVIEKVRGEVGRFYVTTALINVGVGCAIAGAMVALEKPDSGGTDRIFMEALTDANGHFSFCPLPVGAVFDIAFSKDAEQKYIYLADGSNEKVYIIQRDTMEILTSFGDGGRQPGEFYAVHSIASDSKGNLFTTETYRGQRVQKFVYKGLAAVTKMDQGVVWPKK